MVASLFAKGLKLVQSAGQGAKLIGKGGYKKAVKTFAKTDGGVFAKSMAATRAGGSKAAKVWDKLPHAQQKAMLITGGAAGIALT